MSTLGFVGFLACALCVGGWLGVRWSEATHTVNRSIAELVMSVDLDRAQDREADR